MNHTIILDTYEYAKALKKANVPEAQIEVEVARDKERTLALNETINNSLVTKHDIALVHKDIEDSRLVTKHDIALVHKDIEDSRLVTKHDIALVHKDIEDSRLATKHDIALVHKDIEDSRLATKRDIEIIKRDIIIWLGSIMLTGLGLIKLLKL